MSYREEFKKNSNDFSFTKEVIDEVNNLDFKAGSKSLLSSLSSKTEPIATKDNYIWYALSATAEDVGETIYQNVLNYMQNVADIDTCTTKALQSMVQILGSNYNVLDSLSSIPLEILDLVDIFSMRRDCLLDSSVMSKHTLTVLLSSALPSQTAASADEDLSSSPALSNGTLYSKIDSQQLDELISAALYNTMLSNISLTYNFAEDNRPIYSYLSDCILHDNFILPNRHKDKIDEYKTKWNIPKEFDPEEEAAKIDAGLSTFEQYDARQQELLSIEMQREAEAKSELEPRTRYAYFNEKKVKEYFNFVERWYNQINNTYSTAKRYDIDNSYVEVGSNDSRTAVQLLMSENGKDAQLNENMVVVVARQLLDVITQVRDLREYLKSQAQRTYMKGTFLLVSYAVNEYLKKNVYPAAAAIHNSSQYASKLSGVPQIEWEQNDNKLELVEYVDQTQYYNIKSDELEEDQMHIGEDPTSRVKSLNSKFWKDGSTAAGNATFVDTTSIVRKEDKAQLVQSKTFSMEQIADFYENVLGTLKDKQLSSDSQKRTYDFLSTVFETGADDTWWSDQHSKVMAILSNGRSTKDIEDYMSVLNSCYIDSQYVLSTFTPTQGTSLCMQLQTAATNYLASLKDKFSLDISNALSVFDVQMQNAENIINALDDLKEDFDNYKSRLDTFINGSMSYTEGFVKQTSSIYAQQLATDYFAYVESNISNSQIRTSIIGQDNAFQTEHSQLTNMLVDVSKQYAMVVDLSIANCTFNTNPIKSEVQANIKFKYDPADPNDEMSVMSVCYEVLPSQLLSVEHYFEPMYIALHDFVQQLQINYASRKSQIETSLLQLMNGHLASMHLDGIEELSSQLDKENYKYLEYQFLVTECVQDISSLLSYEDDPWYQYKKKLFLKYTGQDVGDTPYYYSQNSAHPSYQIHPCLSNFIEKVDYSYPIKNLAGIADATLKQEMQKIVNSTLSELLDNGYLKNIWKNPLNSNQDYLTRYEKADHHDADLQQNIFFGWDGFVHPATVKSNRELSGMCCFNNCILSSFAKISAILTNGQNYSDYDIEQLSSELDASREMLRLALCSQSSADIVQYGLDIYGNAYILLKQFVDSANMTEMSDMHNILWFRRKNAPIPTLAFACSATTLENDDLDCSYLSSSMFQHHPYANTSIFNDAQLVSACSIDRQTVFTPTFDDFMFSPDKTTLYLRSGNTIMFADILQEYVDDETYVGYRRYALQDMQNREEKLSANSASRPSFKSWYFNGQSVGGIYASEAVVGNDISIQLEVARREKNNYGKPSPHMYANTTLSNVASLTPAYACDAEGDVGISYVKNVPTLDANTSLSALADKNISSYIDIMDNTAIAVKNFKTINDSLVEDADEMLHTQFADVGFMPAISGQNYIAESSQDTSTPYYSQYNDEIAYSRMLKVQIAAPPVPMKLGIDFRRVCPIRVREPNSDSKYGEDSSTFHLSAQSSSTLMSASLSGVLTTYVDVHFLESIYNQYVQQENDEQWYELVDEERLARKHPDASKDAAAFDYLQLAHYDVMRHLSVLRDEKEEQSIGDNDKIVATLSVGEFLGIVQPYMMEEDAIPSTYISGFLVQSNSDQHNGRLFSSAVVSNKNALATTKSCVLKFGRSDISVNWIDMLSNENENGKIKLDFNAPLYLSSQITAKLHVNLSEKPTFNERNKCNLFLNLDVPGEAGILNTYYSTEDNNMLEDIWYIKNISEGHVPKFIIKNILNSLDPEAQLQAFDIAENKLKAGLDNTEDIQTMLLATEDPILTYIAFE